MPSLHLLCGLPGSGKTTLAKELETELPAFRFCPDEWIHSVIEDVSDIRERDRLRDPIEQLQWKSAQRLLSLGTSVILENGFWSRDERVGYLEIARTIGVKVTLHYLQAELDVLWERIRKRNKLARTDSFFVSKEMLDSFLPLFTPPDREEIQLFNAFRLHRAE